MAVKNDGKIRCSFCGKTQEQVNRLIAGPNGAYICDECIDICAEIIDEHHELCSDVLEDLYYAGFNNDEIDSLGYGYLLDVEEEGE